MNKEFNMTTEFTTGTCRPRPLTRWWLRTRFIEVITYDNGLIGAPMELYVPFWAWPLELLHRVVFGSTKIISIK